MRAFRTWITLPVALVAALVAACAGGTPSASPESSVVADAGRPQVVIQSPPGNAQVPVGQAVEVVTTAVDAIGVGRIDLAVNGSTISSAETPPGGLQSFSAVHLWVPATPGDVVLSAVAYRTDGAPSDPMTINVLVLPEGATIVPYPSFGGALPTYRAEAVASGYVAPTYAPNPTSVTAPTATSYANATSTSYANPTATYHANPTATYVANPTATYYASPTPTYAATPTYTTSPTTPIAPPDSTYSWVLPYNGAGEISDYVSYPAGDVEDRVNYDISGMSASPPQNQAHLIVFATCEGLGQEYITFQVGTAKFRCGDKIIDKTVTYDSRTGSIRVYAFAGAYVHWTLSGSAFKP